MKASKIKPGHTLADGRVVKSVRTITGKKGYATNVRGSCGGQKGSGYYINAPVLEIRFTDGSCPCYRWPKREIEPTTLAYLPREGEAPAVELREAA